ncbi:hypothetical protein [Oceanispirochaeta sp.]|jgi:hypothetical protein|uniref:hypothetical protein n=1 Tax=Oceanispirochaeta sp. TaxID=2035350 RepID=UPI002615D0EA|nr:hypothetical protein [Oceanispirochaeta sp.]MDA3958647.1 hypothetical protein [Oceanispirochaeta sp.]
MYPELIQWLKTKTIDLLILPVHGRDPVKEARGIVGNMSFEEALIQSDLSHAGGITEVNEDFVRSQAKIGHDWKNPVWRHKDGSIAEW